MNSDPSTDPERRRAAYRRSLERIAKEREKLPAWMKMTPQEYATYLKRDTSERKRKDVSRSKTIVRRVKIDE